MMLVVLMFRGPVARTRRWVAILVSIRGTLVAPMGLTVPTTGMLLWRWLIVLGMMWLGVRFIRLLAMWLIWTIRLLVLVWSLMLGSYILNTFFPRRATRQETREGTL